MKNIAGVIKALEVAIANLPEENQAAFQPFVGDLQEIDESQASEFRKKNNEAKGLRDRAKNAETALEGLNALKDKYGKVIKTLGFEDDIEDLDEALSGITTKLQAGELSTNQNKDLEAKLKDLNTTITKLTKDIKTASEERDSYKSKYEDTNGKRVNAIKKQAIISALTDNKAVKPNELARILMGSVQVKDDDSLVYVDDRGEEVAVGDGIKKYLEANPEFVANEQKPGSGGGGNGGGGQGGKIKATRAQMKDPAWYDKNRDAIFAGNVEVIE